MAYQRVPDTAEIIVRYTLSGVNIVNTYHAYYPGGYVQGDLNTLAAQIDSVAVPGLLADQSVNISYVRTDVRGLDVENDLTATSNLSAGVGSVASITYPGNVAFCMQRLSGLTGRSARGRVYIAGIPQSYVFGDPSRRNEITTVAANAYKSHIDGFRTTIDAIGAVDPVIVSRYHEGSKRPEGVVFAWTITDYEDQKLDTMRRRMS